jgi:hypothetical protein
VLRVEAVELPVLDGGVRAWVWESAENATLDWHKPTVVLDHGFKMPRSNCSPSLFRELISFFHE